jgi:hypothetical protein
MSKDTARTDFLESKYYIQGTTFNLSVMARQIKISITRARQLMNELGKENLVYKHDQDVWAKKTRSHGILSRPLACQITVREALEDAKLGAEA